MNKLMIKAMLKKNEVVSVIKDKVNNNRGLIMIEWILLVILIAGALVLATPLIKASVTKFTGLFDTIITEKINGIK